MSNKSFEEVVNCLDKECMILDYIDDALHIMDELRIMCDTDDNNLFYQSMERMEEIRNVISGRAVSTLRRSYFNRVPYYENKIMAEIKANGGIL